MLPKKQFKPSKGIDVEVLGGSSDEENNENEQPLTDSLSTINERQLKNISSKKRKRSSSQDNHLKIEDDFTTEQVPNRLEIDNNVYDFIDCISDNNDNLFHVGEKKLILFSKDNFSIENAHLYIYRYNYRLSRDRYIKKYILYKIEKNNKNSGKLFKIGYKNDLETFPIILLKENIIRITVKSLKHKQNDHYRLKYDIYLTDKLNRIDAILYPSDNYNHQYTKIFRNLMNDLLFNFVNKSKNSFQSNIQLSPKEDDCETPSPYEVYEADDDYKSAQDTLFELVHDINKKHNVIDDKEIDLIQKYSCLNVLLRPYQINAVKWMLQKEKFNFACLDAYWLSSSLLPASKASDLHILYNKLQDKNSNVIYYNKHFGIFSKEMPVKQQPILGGILADEMGLGKTLEILACILLHQRPQSELKEKPYELEFSENAKKSKASLKNSKLFVCVCGKQFKSLPNVNNEFPASANSIYQCAFCGILMHPKCMNYSGLCEEFICVTCHNDLPIIPSKCTLIVTPFIISHQWVEEIERHLDKKLNILVYKGAQNGYAQPRDLANLDICLTTFDVLSNELSHTYAAKNARSLRGPKRFPSLPCPLLNVEWWRICLDEAQMVHSTNSKCAEMASRLESRIRWCVSGTPIGKSLSDLQSLFAFLREDPYCEPRWFNEFLFIPFQNKNFMNMALEVSKVLWRNTKKFVQNQIKIPPQTEKVYWLDFSPFEVHLYDCVREQFRNKFLRFKEPIVRNSKNLRLDELDRRTINNLLAPILNLRITCNHPQLILRKSDFMSQVGEDQDEKLLSMEKSLELLTKKTKWEAETNLRCIASSSNAIAGLKIIQEKYIEAIKLYQYLLDTEMETKMHDVNLDKITLIHIYHNYAIALDYNSISKKELLDNQKLQELNEKLKQSEASYVFDSKEHKIKCEHIFKKHFEENDLFNKNLEYCTKLLKMLTKLFDSIAESSLFEDFWQKITNEFTVQKVKHHYNSTQSFEIRVNGQHIESIQDLKMVLIEEFEKMLIKREETLDQFLVLFEKEDKIKMEGIFFTNQDAWNSSLTSELVAKVAACHLRPQSFQQENIDRSIKCPLCQLNSKFRAYTKFFSSKYYEENYNSFSSHSRKIKAAIEKPQEEFSIEDFQNFGEVNIPCDLETILRHISWSIRHTNLVSLSNSAAELTRHFSYLKDEQKKLSSFLQSVSNQINAYDEIEMAKTRMRLMLPDENVDFKLIESVNIVRPFEIEDTIINNELDKVENEKKLRRKLNQIIYLKNLEKSYEMKNDQENKDNCPICSEKFGYEWYILTCGHLFCKSCNNGLLKSCEIKGHVRCALCRELCLHKESYLVSTLTKKNKNKLELSPALVAEFESFVGYEQELKDVQINGKCNSAKVEGVVKCLMKLIRENKKVKCVVFSEHFVILDLIVSLMHENSIGFTCVKTQKFSSQKAIDAFKMNDDINVLLMLYSHGANGLNLIEATHVLLVEPTLNKSQEIQAIGRVHRIGQTKPTFVHRFIIRHTIEEHVYKLFNLPCTESNSDKPTTSSALTDNIDKKDVMLTVGDIYSLFKSL